MGELDLDAYYYQIREKRQDDENNFAVCEAQPKVCGERLVRAADCAGNETAGAIR